MGFDDFYGTLHKSARAAWTVAAVAVVLGVVGVGYGLMANQQAAAAQAQVVPIRIDETGVIAPLPRMDQATWNDHVVRSEIIKYVKSVRTLTPDPSVLTGNLQTAMAMQGEQPLQLMRERMFIGDQKHPEYPITLARSWLRSVELRSVVKAQRGDGTFEVKWKEHTRPITGGAATTVHYEGLITVAQRAPKAIGDYGVYIETFDYVKSPDINN